MHTHTYTYLHILLFFPFSHLHDSGQKTAVDPRNLLLGDDGLDTMEEAVVLVGAAELKGRGERK